MIGGEKVNCKPTGNLEISWQLSLPNKSNLQLEKLILCVKYKGNVLTNELFKAHVYDMTLLVATSPSMDIYSLFKLGTLRFSLGRQ